MKDYITPSERIAIITAGSGTSEWEHRRLLELRQEATRSHMIASGRYLISTPKQVPAPMVEGRRGMGIVRVWP